MSKLYLYVFLAAMFLVAVFACENNERGINKELSTAEKVDSVLELMTLDEKIGQLNQFTGNWQNTGPLVNDTTKFNKIRKNAKAILFTWWLGTEAGNGIADVLFGEYNPSAKLPVTFPAHIAQVPIYYNYKNTGRPENPDITYSTRYIDIPFQPAYPFGYGLSYTQFEYSRLQLDKKQYTSDEKVKATVQVKNIGNRNGEEVIQLYVRDKVASITRPLKELKGIQKIRLKAGESANISFEISQIELGYWNEKRVFVVEPGAFAVMIGTNSNDYLSTDFEIVTQ